jgi:inosine/xanthosine triphosphatase
MTFAGCRIYPNLSLGECPISTSPESPIGISVALASTNPVKKQAVQHGFHRFFHGQPIDVTCLSGDSPIAAQPLTSNETLRGASLRAKQAREGMPEANYWVGIEGGIEDTLEGMLTFAWVVVLDQQWIGRSRSGAFLLPTKVADLVREGYELGTADDMIFGGVDTKRKNGAIGLLSGNVLDRAGLYEQAVILALLPFRNPDLYPAGWD